MDNHNGLEAVLREWIANQGNQPASLSEMEESIRAWLYRVGNLLLYLWLLYVTLRYDAACVSWVMSVNFCKKGRRALSL